MRFALPGFTPDAEGKAQAIALETMVAHIAAIADAVSPDQPVTLPLHDWGCIFGYEFVARRAARVARVARVVGGGHWQPQQRRVPALANRPRLTADCFLPSVAGTGVAGGPLA